MIYLTFDTNIWVYSLDNAWTIENELDYIESWIEQDKIKLLLPEVILTEWKRRKSEHVSERKKKLKEFFSMAEEILPSAFFSDYKTPEIQDQIINSQLGLIENLLSKAEIIPSNLDIQQKVIDWGIRKKAPLHNNSSIADAIIAFSLIQFADERQGNQFFFVSNNTKDFYEKKNKEWEIHSDLKPDFESLNITSYRELNRLTYDLREFHGLEVDENLGQKRKDQIKEKLKERAYNPEYEKITADSKSSFIQNIEMIELILKKEKPTKEQVIFCLALIDSDPNYEREFYKRLKKQSWFEILLEKGAFNHKNNPSPIREDKGVVTPFWQPLSYLEELSTQIQDEEDFDLASEIIDVIQQVSLNPRDNPRTWYAFVKILVNLPGETIPLEVLDFIPVWLNKNLDALYTTDLCEKLLPKFLSETPNRDDILKAERILNHLFTLEKKEEAEGFNELRFGGGKLLLATRFTFSRESIRSGSDGYKGCSALLQRCSYQSG